jgi:phosphonate metabolism protein PhnN/1,5-bisphosphokinase (PRPP-forming)
MSTWEIPAESRGDPAPMPSHLSEKGTLFLVSGSSGAGKDAVIEGARRLLGGDGRFAFPLRTITRPEGFGGEIHVAVTPAQFDRLRRRGTFALCWGARGLNYAIPATIDLDLASGRNVVVNVSSTVFAEARARYQGAIVIWVAASVELRRQRLLVRGRESSAEIEERLSFTEDVPADDDVEVLVNDGSLEDAVGGFVALLKDRAGLFSAGKIGAAEREIRLQ